MDVIDRLIELRKCLKLSQTEFGEHVGVTIGVVRNIEKRLVPPKDLFLKQICKEYKVDYLWLTEGKGNMFCDDLEQVLDDLQKDYKLDEFDKLIMRKYLQLSHEQRMVLKDFLKSITEK